MKKPLLFSITIGAIVVGTALSIILSDAWSTTGTDLESIRNDAFDKTDRVAIYHPFDTLIFEKRGEQWWYGTEELEQKAVENLVYASGNIRLRSILPMDQLDTVIHQTGFAFFHGDKETSRLEFLETPRFGLVHAVGASETYAVLVPGFEQLDLRKVFQSDADQYRKQLIISLLPNEIQSIQVSPIRGSGFMVRQDSVHNLTVNALQDEMASPDSMSGLRREVDERKMRLLFSYFNPIRFNRVIGTRELITGEEALAEVLVTDWSGGVYRMRVYPIHGEGETEPDLFQAKVLFNDEARLLEVDYIYLDLIIRGLESYVQKNPSNG